MENKDNVYLPRYRPVSQEQKDSDKNLVSTLTSDLSESLAPVGVDPSKAKSIAEEFVKIKSNFEFDQYPISSKFLRKFICGEKHKIDAEWPSLDPLKNTVEHFKVHITEETCPKCGGEEVMTIPSSNTSPELYVCDQDEYRFVTFASLESWAKE